MPKELQPILAARDVRSVHVETLEANGAATRALGYPASYAVLGVETKARKHIELVPPEFHQFKGFCLVSGALACALGVIGLSQGWIWLGAFALVGGTHTLRAAQRIPTSPFLVSRYRS